MKFLNWWHFRRINFWKTFLINLLFLPLKQAMIFPIVVRGKCALITNGMGKIILPDDVKSGMVQIGSSDPCRSYGKKTVICINGKLILTGNVVIRRGCRLHVSSDAEIELGKNVFISDNCSLISLRRIAIGLGTIIGHDCSIADSDFHFVIDTEQNIVKDSTKTIQIGVYNWLGAWTFVKKGTCTPAHTIVAGPYSMLDKDYCNIVPEHSILAGCPAKYKRTGVEMVRDLDLQARLGKYFDKHEANTCHLHRVNNNFVFDVI